MTVGAKMSDIPMNTEQSVEGRSNSESVSRIPVFVFSLQPKILEPGALHLIVSILRDKKSVLSLP